MALDQDQPFELKADDPNRGTVKGVDIVSPCKPLHSPMPEELFSQQGVLEGKCNSAELFCRIGKVPTPSRSGCSRDSVAIVPSSSRVLEDDRDSCAFHSASDDVKDAIGDCRNQSEDNIRLTNSSSALFVNVDGGSDRHGSGVLMWPDGRRYVGQFNRGTLEGEATMTWPDGRVYIGNYYMNKKHGEGLFMWPDGRKYAGQWDAGRRHGRGMYTNAKGEARVGSWSKDQPVEWDPPEAKKDKSSERVNS